MTQANIWRARAGRGVLGGRADVDDFLPAVIVIAAAAAAAAADDDDDDTLPAAAAVDAE